MVLCSKSRKFWNSVQLPARSLPVLSPHHLCTWGSAGPASCSQSLAAFPLLKEKFCKQHSHGFLCICAHSTSASPLCWLKLCFCGPKTLSSSPELLVEQMVTDAGHFPRCCLPGQQHQQLLTPSAVFPANWGCQIESLGSTKMPADGFEMFIWSSHKFYELCACCCPICLKSDEEFNS